MSQGGRGERTPPPPPQEKKKSGKFGHISGKIWARPFFFVGSVHLYNLMYPADPNYWNRRTENFGHAWPFMLSM